MIALILIVVAAICKAIMDVVQFRYNVSVFSLLNREQWFNPKVSKNNKWRGGNKKNGERFPGSSTIFVLVTDAWHFFQAVRHLCFFAAIILYTQLLPYRWLDFLLLYTVHNVVFELFFSKIFILKTKSNEN